jgi:hypothetical protein
MRSSGRSPNRVEPKQVLINQRLNRISMPQRRYSANGVSGGRADEIGVRLDDAGLEISGNQLFIDAIAPARNHEYRLVGIGALEYQGLGNLLDLAPNCCRSLFGGTSGLRQNDHSCVETFGFQRLLEQPGGVGKFVGHAKYSEWALENGISCLYQELRTRQRARGEVRGSGRVDVAPLHLLQDYAVAVFIFVGAPLSIPVGIERRNLLETGRKHVGARAFPIAHLWNIEDSQVFLCGRWRDRVRATVCELEMVTRVGKPEHHAVESFVVLEAADDMQAKAPTVHCLCSCEIADRPRNSKMMRHLLVVRASCVLAYVAGDM